MNIKHQCIDYQSLVNTFKDLQSCRKKLDDFILFQDKSFSDLKQFLQNWSVRNDLGTIVEDVNDLLGSPDTAENVGQLHGMLDNAKKMVEELEHAVQNLEEVYGNLRQKPDRHGKAETSRKVDLFLNSLGELHILQIRQTVDATIPGLIKEIQTVLEAFNIENDKCADNIEFADQLLKRIKVFRGFANKFNAADVCDSCESRITPVKQPSRIDPDKDRKTLLAVEKELDALRDAFDKEQEQFDELEEEIDDKKSELWEEDYNIFTPVFDDPSCNVESTVEDLRSSFEQFTARKRGDIAAVENRFPPRITNRYHSDFNSIRNSFVSRSKLDELVGKIEYFIKERNKKILKILGIVAGGIAAIVLLVRFWKIILAALFIIGIIAYIANRD